MRYNTRYTRTLHMITAPEIPRLANGGVALCHLCQRRTFFAGGFLQLLASQVYQLSKYGKIYKFGK